MTSRQILAAISTLIMGPVLGGMFGMMGLLSHLLDKGACTIPWQVHLTAFAIGPISTIYIEYNLLGLSLEKQIQKSKEYVAEERTRYGF